MISKDGRGAILGRLPANAGIVLRVPISADIDNYYTSLAYTAKKK